jgi:hypothetical protein
LLLVIFSFANVILVFKKLISNTTVNILFKKTLLLINWLEPYNLK